MHTSFFTKLTNPFQNFINAETYLRNFFLKRTFILYGFIFTKL